jgi:hypothetical protein
MLVTNNIQQYLVPTLYQSQLPAEATIFGVLRKGITITRHQQHSLLSLEASGSLWELANQNRSIVKFQTLMDKCSGNLVHLGALAKHLGGHTG